MDLFLLQKTNKEKDGRTKNGKRPGNVKGLRERIYTLNICGIKNKDPDIVEFMKKWKTSVLGISDCRLKGNGTRQMQDNYVLTWSGVNTRERAIHGVAFIAQPGRAKKVLETDFVSERIVKTRLKYEHRNETIIQIYALCNDTYSEEEKAEFFEKLSGTIDSVPDNDDLIVMGDFNGRVGSRRTPWETYPRPTQRRQYRIQLQRRTAAGALC